MIDVPIELDEHAWRLISSASSSLLTVLLRVACRNRALQYRQSENNDSQLSVQGRQGGSD